MLEHERDARSAIGPEVLLIETTLDTDTRAGRDEEFEDVSRDVREIEGLVRVRARPVDEDAAVRADAPAQERPRGTGDHRRLPRLEDDRPLVLLAGAVLREQAGPMPVVGKQRHHPTVVRELSADLVLRDHARDEV